MQYKKLYLSIFAAVMVLVITLLFTYLFILKDDGARLSQQVDTYIQTEPSFLELMEYLTRYDIDFDIQNKMPRGDAESVTRHLGADPRRSSYIIFRIYDVKKTWCGVSYDMYIVVYDKSGSFI